MKGLLLLLSALIFAVPAWAADTAGAAPAAQATAPAAEPGKEAPKKAHKKKKAKAKAKAKSAAATEGATGCVSPCTITNCPPPSGPIICCHPKPVYGAC